MRGTHNKDQTAAMKFLVFPVLLVVTCVEALRSNQWIPIPRLSIQTYKQSSANLLRIPGSGHFVDKLQLSIKSFQPLNSTAHIDAPGVSVNTPVHSVKKSWGIGARRREHLEAHKGALVSTGKP